MEKKRVCQCPERGDLHFYERKLRISELKTVCVNALKGATSISTKDKNALKTDAYKVSMP